VITNLAKLANHLDEKGFQKEADYLDSIINKIAEPSYEMETNPDWTWEEGFWDPSDEGYNDPQGLLETGEASKSLSDPELLMELDEEDIEKEEEPYWRDQDDLRAAAKKFFSFMDKNEDGAIDQEEHLRLWEAVVSIVRDMNSDATNEEVVDIVIREMDKADELLSEKQEEDFIDEWSRHSGLETPGVDFGELGNNPEYRNNMREKYRRDKSREKSRVENLAEDRLESS
tara:strand:+ start:97 stop:783 length:687 start_codon:yes stop_codon:yes gene_type:complete